jgi:hypothetical protein
MTKTWLAFLAAFGLAACGDEGKKGEEPVYPDALDVTPELPFEVPEYVFDLVTDEGGVEEVEPEGWVDGPGDGDAALDERSVPDEKKEDKKEKDEGGDGACQPQCTFEDGTPKECGEDGCDSICGYCDYEHQCVQGKCEVICIPQCTMADGTPKQCGPDGCYGDCPPGCDKNFKCGEDGLCYPDCDHDANCAGKECGPDGCGGTCGTCASGKMCDDEAGLCVADPCGDIPKDTGKCSDDNKLIECVNGKPKETDCAAMGEDYYCKWDAPQAKYVCAQGCVPKCTFPDGTPVECGYDGCYGTCGTCSSGWDCKAGHCYPNEGAACGYIDAAGLCIDNVLWFCNLKLYKDDCPAMGKNCKFDKTVMKYKCL